MDATLSLRATFVALSLALLTGHAGAARAQDSPGRPALVTVGEWNRCAAERACPFRLAGDPAAPATEVSWHDAQLYLAWISARTGRIHRLPTLSEWKPGKTGVAEWLDDCHADAGAACSHRMIRPAAPGEPQALSPDLRLSDVGFRAIGP